MVDGRRWTGAAPASLAVLALLAAGACGADPAPPVPEGSGPTSPTPSPAPSTQPTPSSPAPDPRSPPPPAPGTTPPAWLGARVLPERPDGYGEVRPTPPELARRRFTLEDTVSPLPGRGFAARVDRVPRAVLRRSTWQPGCPVAATDLRWVRVTFAGFDAARHTGELLVHRRVAGDVVDVFADLWEADFPLEELRITTQAELDAPPTGDGNNTSAFVCRPVTGGTAYSQHAYGTAIDVNPFQNPYVRDDLVLPELASAYVDRARRGPGMIRRGGPVVRAFTAVGWSWGGDYRTLKDYHHFSESGG